MANRTHLTEMNKARNGEVSAQLSLAKRYLFGETGFPCNEVTALLWLDRAARQGCSEAWILIGSHISVEIAQRSPDLLSILGWYKRAFEEGVVNAGMVFAKLVLTQDALKGNGSLLAEALKILETLSRTGMSDAQWLLAQNIESVEGLPMEIAQAAARINDVSVEALFVPECKTSAAEWTISAAIGGVREARFALADRAWAKDDCSTFLQWALPLSREISQDSSIGTLGNNVLLGKSYQLTDADAELLYRCGELLGYQEGFDAAEPRLFFEVAAHAGNKSAQLHQGLWCAKIDPQNLQVLRHPRRARFNDAINWLAQSGNQGSAEAWYIASKIYLRAEFAGRSLVEAERLLERAAELGHCAAQLELGVRTWRTRHKNINADLLAAYWLQKATGQGSIEAATLLKKIAPPSKEALWAQERLPSLTPDVVNAHPLLAARIELAALFGLTQLEALWLGVIEADRGHCLLIDVSDNAPKTKRRLVSIQTEKEREALDRAKLLFQGIDHGRNGPEGNYRKRLYSLEKLARTAMSELLPPTRDG